jgi:aminopeptidase N
VLEALQNFRNDAKVVAAVKPFLEKGDPSYYVEAEALNTYASIRADDARAWLEKGLAKPSHNDVIREHAVSALASLEDPSVLPILEKIATEPGKYEHGVRAHAVHAWARVAALPGVTPEARQKVVERLAQMVDKEGIRLRWSAIDALGGLGKEATTALAAVDAAVQRDGEGRIRDAAKRAADRIRAGTPPNVEVARLRDEIQKLKENEEKLVKRLERVEAKGTAPAPGTSPAPSPAPAPVPTPTPTQPGGDRQPD